LGNDSPVGSSSDFDRERFVWKKTFVAAKSGAFLFKEILYDIANGAYYLALPISGWLYRLHARSSVYGFRGGFRVESDVFEATSAGKLTAERARPFGRNERYA